jgi:bifunctional UDP-N-acetylglucosamine pyrophosphorylase/glucosamine-1-phosphate N-acetyltransferase
VAPVEVGDGAYTAAGSVITGDVPPGALGVSRAQQRNIDGWVQRKRPGTPAAEAAERAQGERPQQAERAQGERPQQAERAQQAEQAGAEQAGTGERGT